MTRTHRPLSRAAAALFERGCQEHRERRFERAEASFRAVLELAPGAPLALANLAEVLRASGQREAALLAFAEALAADPNNSLLRNNHGGALLEAGRLDAAIAELRRALELEPRQHRARNNLGNALLSLGRLEEAAAAFEAVLAAHPDSWPALASLGAARVRLGQHEAALPVLLRAVQLEPRAAEPRVTLAGCLASVGLVEESLQQYRAALQLRPGLLEAWSPMLFTLHHGAGHPPRALFDEAVRFGEALERAVAGETRTSWRNDRAPNRRLRVGYVSPDLRRHPVGFFLAPVVEAHDRAALELYAYSDARVRDGLNARLRAAMSVFRDTAQLGDAALAAQIEADQIDVLIDLAGHTTGNRLGVFARRPAPVQVSWLGYPDTTGLRAIGWRITDAVADPPGPSDALHTEQLLRLPHGFLAWSRQGQLAPAPAPPSASTGAITFGCFNNFSKLSPPLAALWSELLLAVPDSTLLLKSRGLALPESRARLFSWFGARDLPPGRIEILDFAASPEEALRDYARVDLALDPFPYNGTTTTCEALSMGVPLVALRGATHAGRVSASILESLGERALIAESVADYLRIAVGLARDPARLAALRAELPERFSRAPIGDPARLARELEAALRFAWLHS